MISEYRKRKDSVSYIIPIPNDAQCSGRQDSQINHPRNKLL